MKIFLGIAISVITLVFIGFIVMYSGIVNVSVLEPPSGFTKWVLSTTKENSVESRADAIQPPVLSDATMIQEGAEHYSSMCVGCHGAPGIETSEMAQGLEPKAPLLYETEEANKLNEAQEFWIVKNGIMLTGMPAWGVTHSDEKIWNIVAFLQKLPDLSADEYNAMTTESSESETEHTHSEHEMDGHTH